MFITIYFDAVSIGVCTQIGLQTVDSDEASSLVECTQWPLFWQFPFAIWLSHSSGHVINHHRAARGAWNQVHPVSVHANEVHKSKRMETNDNAWSQFPYLRHWFTAILEESAVTTRIAQSLWEMCFVAMTSSHCKGQIDFRTENSLRSVASCMWHRLRQ